MYDIIRSDWFLGIVFLFIFAMLILLFEILVPQRPPGSSASPAGRRRYLYPRQAGSRPVAPKSQPASQDVI